MQTRYLFINYVYYCGLIIKIKGLIIRFLIYSVDGV